MVNHYKRFFSKKEVFFVKNKNFYVNSSRKSKRKAQPREKLCRRIDPKRPERTEKPRKQRRIKHETHSAPCRHARPESAAADGHGEGEDGKRRECAEENIEQNRHRAAAHACMHAHNTQKVVNERA